MVYLNYRAYKTLRNWLFQKQNWRVSTKKFISQKSKIQGKPLVPRLKSSSIPVTTQELISILGVFQSQ